MVRGQGRLRLGSAELEALGGIKRGVFDLRLSYKLGNLRTGMAAKAWSHRDDLAGRVTHEERPSKSLRMAAFRGWLRRRQGS